MQKQCLYLGNALSIHGNTPTSVETVGYRMSEFVKVKLGSSFQNKILRLFHFWFLIFRYRKYKNVLIDTYSTSGFWFAISCSYLCKLFKLNYIPILHGGNLKVRTEISPKIYFSYLNDAYLVVCPSDFTKDIMYKFCERDYQIIPNSIEITNYSFNLRSLKSIGIRLLWVRSFHSIYNPLLAIKILSELRNQGYNANLTMVGPDKDGSLEICKESAFNLGVASNVEFPGLMLAKDWHNLAKNHTIFINTSNIDNTPVSLIEAMALGLPLISTNVGGIPYLIENMVTGILVPSNDASEFVRAIEYLNSNENLYQELAVNGRKKAELFDWGIVKQQWLDILR